MCLKLFSSAPKKEKTFKRKLADFLNFKPKNIHLYKLALMHKSLKNYNNTNLNSERLEFLGDSVLNTVISEYLYTKYSEEDQGFLSENKSKIVSNDSLVSYFNKMDTENIIDFNDINTSKGIQADTLEAIIGAIFLDKGFKKAKQFIKDKLIYSQVENNNLRDTIINYKGFILNWGVKEGKEITFIHTEHNPNHENTYKVLMKIDNKVVESAYGKSKKKAEQSVAKLFYNQQQ